MHAVVIYETLTGNTRRAAGLIGTELVRAGHQAPQPSEGSRAEIARAIHARRAA